MFRYQHVDAGRRARVVDARVHQTQPVVCVVEVRLQEPAERALEMRRRVRGM